MKNVPVEWSSSDAGVATITAAGVATSVGVGNTTIAATSEGVTGSAALTVSSAVLASITVTPASPLMLGTNQSFSAIGT